MRGMIDRTDPTESTLAQILWIALKNYNDDQLVEWLTDDDEVVRLAAANQLHSRILKEASFVRLISLAQSPRHEQREACACALGQLGTPKCKYADRSFPILHALMDDPYYEVRISAIVSIGTLSRLGRQPPAVVEQKVFELAGDDRAEVRSAVGYALLSFKGERVDDGLERLSRDSEPMVVDAALFALEAREEIRESSGG